jgi:serine/threonine protein phosphatase 1
MRVLAIGDIHGCLQALLALTKIVPFEGYEAVVTLGDHIDRGPDSRGVVQWLIDWSRDHRLISLKGNHEVLLLQALENRFGLRSWLEVGGMQTIESYQSETRPNEIIPDGHRLFLEQCLPWWETETHIFVHAALDPALPLDKQTEKSLYWSRVDLEAEPHVSGKHVICGHTAQRDGIPKGNGHLTCIDTWAYGGGWLTAMDVNTGAYWQAREDGEVRRGMIDS